MIKHRYSLKSLLENLINEDQNEPSEEELSQNFMKLLQDEGDLKPGDERLSELESFFERTIPSIDSDIIMEMITDPNCTLEFDGHNLIWVSGSGNQLYSWPAISGYTKEEPYKDSYRYDPKIYQDKSGGPTPEGKYQIGFPEIKKDDVKAFLRAIKSLLPGTDTRGYNWNVAGSQGSWGRIRYMLYPEGHNAFGRSNMYIHGGSVPGSLGCIDLMMRVQEFGYILAAWMLMSSLMLEKSIQTTPIYLEVNYDNWSRKDKLPDVGSTYSPPDESDKREYFDGDY